MAYLLLVALLIAAGVWTVGLYGLFAMFVWRLGSPQDIRRWRVSILSVVVTLCIVLIVIIFGLLVETIFGHSVQSPQPPPALTIGMLALELVLGSSFGIAAATSMVLLTLAMVWRNAFDHDILVEYLWLQVGLKNWLGRDIPDSPTRSVIR